MAPPKRAPKDLGPLTPTTLRDYCRFNGGKTVIQHFRVLDQDGDGDLTRKEFAKAARAMGFLNATKEECDFVFAWLDTDGSGTVPYKELDKKLRDRPIETDGEKKKREADEAAAAEKAAAEAAAEAVAAKAAAAEAAAEAARAAAMGAEEMTDSDDSEFDEAPPPVAMSTGFKLNMGMVQREEIDSAKPNAVPHTPKGEVLEMLRAKAAAAEAAAMDAAAGTVASPTVEPAAAPAQPETAAAKAGGNAGGGAATVARLCSCFEACLLRRPGS